MQRVSPRARLLGFGALAGLLGGVLVVFMLMGSQGTPTARALSQTPTPTPKPAGTGNLSGLFDINAGPGLYNCISRTDHDGGTNIVKSAAQCYTQLDTGAPGGEPPCAAWHGPGPQGANPSVPIRAGEGPCSPDVGNPQQPLMPPPPPYTAQQPSKLLGSYCPAGPACAAIPGDNPATTVLGDTLTEVGCFADIGGTLGPNVISVVVLGTGRTGDVPLKLGLKVQDPSGTPGTVINGWTFLVTAATNAQCTAANGGTVAGPLPPTQTWIPLQLTRRATTRVFTGVGSCTDMQKLGHGQSDSVKECGDDPFNPYDAQGATPDITGSYDFTLEITRADVGAPGEYIAPCKVVLAAGGTGGASCYWDKTTLTVNPAAAGNTACPPANAKYCGDGQPGAAPPGCNSAAGTCAVLAGQGAGCPTVPCDTSQYQFLAVTKSATLSWVVSGQTLTVTWCQQYGPNAPWLAINKIDIYTGEGKDIIYLGLTDANCKALTTTGATSTDNTTTVAVRQAPGDTSGGCVANPGVVGYTGCRDSDGDGCPDVRELANTQSTGGRRDPSNRWDYFNPEKAGTAHSQGGADISYVVGHYNKNQGNALYTIDSDRTGILGANSWNAGPPDGKVSGQDITVAVNQYNQNC